jgi:hypothetical protein
VHEKFGFEQPSNYGQSPLSEEELGQIRAGNDGYPIYSPPVDGTATGNASAGSEPRSAEGSGRTMDSISDPGSLDTLEWEGGQVPPEQG